MPDDLWKAEQRKTYVARRVREEADWALVPWTDEFIDITGDLTQKPRFRTRLKMAWDDEFFHFRAEMEEPHVWGTLTEKNAVIYHDNDFEIFLDPDRDGLNYYEFEMNALGTIWELSLPKPYRDGGNPILGCNIEGLRSKVLVHGSVNNANNPDDGWEAHVSIPWKGLQQYHAAQACPPKPGDRWRANFSRVQWKHEIVDGEYVRVPPHSVKIPWPEHPEDNWVWSPQGVIDMHRPERWGEVVFA